MDVKQHSAKKDVASKHVRNHEARQPQVKKKKKKKKKRKKKKKKKRVLFRFKRFGFVCEGVSNVGGYKRSA